MWTINPSYGPTVAPHRAYKTLQNSPLGSTFVVRLAENEIKMFMYPSSRSGLSCLKSSWKRRFFCGFCRETSVKLLSEAGTHRSRLSGSKKLDSWKYKSRSVVAMLKCGVIANQPFPGCLFSFTFLILFILLHTIDWHI